MDFSSPKDHGDFILRCPPRESTIHPLSNTFAPSTTHHFPKMASSPKKITPIDRRRPPILKQKNPSTTDPPTEITPPATPSEDPPTILLPSDLTRYEIMLRESVLARKNPRRRTITPSHRIERVSMSRNDFRKLDQALGGIESDLRWPSISFNSRNSLGIIEWMPSGVHERLVSAFIGRHEIAREDLPKAVAERVGVVGSQRIGGFTGQYQDSKKEADVLFTYEQQNRNILYTCAIEIGFFETYEELVEDARLWIEGQHDVKTVILIKVVEDPLYRSPIHTLREDEIKRLDFSRLRELNISMVVLEDQADKFGKLQLRNLTWVGKMYAFLEIWKANTGTGNAERQGARKHFVGRTDDEIAELDIKLSDLYPIDAGVGGKRLPLTWERLRQELEKARYEIAVDRCRDTLKKFAKGEDSKDDPDYVYELLPKRRELEQASPYILYAVAK